MLTRIGIPRPTSADLEYNQACWPQYARAVQEAGGEAVLLPLGIPGAELLPLLRTCDGFVLPGSPADVDPALYGQAFEEGTAPADPGRDACDVQVWEHVDATGKPALAICYGLQRLNVLQGGTLIQHLLPQPVPHSAGPAVAVAHSVLVAAQSLLAGLLSSAEAPGGGDYRRLPVNSSHHQAIAIPGDDLTVVARCAQDGVIEAVEGRIGQAAVIGVQWHPERSTAISAASRALFLWLVSEAEDSQAQREGEDRRACAD